VTEQFRAIFSRAAAPAARAKFLSRLFGVFSEEIILLWATDERAPYESLGRPTIKSAGDSRGHTLDFTLRERSTGRVFVAEMKCEIEYQGFRYFVLERLDQLEHHTKPAFEALLRAAARAQDQTVYVGGKPVNTQGAILIWGSATPEGRKAVIDSGFHDVLTVAEICRDLASWNHAGYRTLISHRREWSNELFSGLLGESLGAAQPQDSADRGLALLARGR
jgi:hypothetical protein